MKSNQKFHIKTRQTTKKYHKATYPITMNIPKETSKGSRPDGDSMTAVGKRGQRIGLLDNWCDAHFGYEFD